MEAAEGLSDPINVNEEPSQGPAAAFVAWSRLRAAMRSWGANGQRGLIEWMVRQGLGHSFRPGQYLERIVQDFILNRAQASHPGVEDLQRIYEAVTVHLGQHPERIQEGSLGRPPRSGRVGPRATRTQPSTAQLNSEQPPAAGPGETSNPFLTPPAGPAEALGSQRTQRPTVHAGNDPPRTTWLQLDAVDLAA